MTEIKRKPRATKPKYELSCEYVEPLKKIGFNFEWLDNLHNEYGFSKFEYVHKFQAFRCYKDDKHVDWIDINDLSLLNGGRALVVILLKHGRVSPKRAVIQYKWR